MTLEPRLPWLSGERLPLDPDDLRPLVEANAIARRWTIIWLIASALAWTGTVQLLRAGLVALGVVVGVVGLLPTILCVVFLLGWLYRNGRGPSIVLDPSVVEEFRAAVDRERHNLEEDPPSKDIGPRPAAQTNGPPLEHPWLPAANPASNRLWALAQHLTSVAAAVQPVTDEDDGGANQNKPRQSSG